MNIRGYIELNIMISHLYLSGGGLKGMCYFGIIRYLYLENLIDNIKCIYGTSIGAFFAAVIALRIPIELIEAEFRQFIDDINEHLSINKNNLSNLFCKNGLLSIEFMVKPIIKYIESTFGCDDITFIDFIKRTGVDININTKCLNSCKYCVFSAQNTPNVSVISAIRASMSIPFMFEPICIDGEYYMDCLVSNFDIENVDKRYLLIIYLPPDKTENRTIYAKGTNFNLLDHIMRVSDIFLDMALQDAANRAIDNEYVFQPNDLPYESHMKFKITDKEIVVDVTKEDVSDMTIKGFIDFAIYMKNRFNK